MSDVKRRVCKSWRVHRLQTRRLRWHLAIDRCRSLQPRSSRRILTVQLERASLRTAYCTLTRIHTEYCLPEFHEVLGTRQSPGLLLVPLPCSLNLKCLPTSIVYTTHSFPTIPSVLRLFLAFSRVTSNDRTTIVIRYYRSFYAILFFLS